MSPGHVPRPVTDRDVTGHASECQKAFRRRTSCSQWTDPARPAAMRVHKEPVSMHARLMLSVLRAGAACEAIVRRELPLCAASAADADA